MYQFKQDENAHQQGLEKKEIKDQCDFTQLQTLQSQVQILQSEVKLLKMHSFLKELSQVNLIENEIFNERERQKDKLAEEQAKLFEPDQRFESKTKNEEGSFNKNETPRTPRYSKAYCLGVRYTYKDYSDYQGYDLDPKLHPYHLDKESREIWQTINPFDHKLANRLFIYLNIDYIPPEELKRTKHYLSQYSLLQQEGAKQERHRQQLVNELYTKYGSYRYDCEDIMDEEPLDPDYNFAFEEQDIHKYKFRYLTRPRIIWLIKNGLYSLYQACLDAEEGFKYAQNMKFDLHLAHLYELTSDEYKKLPNPKYLSVIGKMLKRGYHLEQFKDFSRYDFNRLSTGEPPEQIIRCNRGHFLSKRLQEYRIEDMQGIDLNPDFSPYTLKDARYDLWLKISPYNYKLAQKLFIYSEMFYIPDEIRRQFQDEILKNANSQKLGEIEEKKRQHLVKDLERECNSYKDNGHETESDVNIQDILKPQHIFITEKNRLCEYRFQYLTFPRIVWLIKKGLYTCEEAYQDTKEAFDNCGKLKFDLRRAHFDCKLTSNEFRSLQSYKSLRRVGEMLKQGHHFEQIRELSISQWRMIWDNISQWKMLSDHKLITSVLNHPNLYNDQKLSHEIPDDTKLGIVTFQAPIATTPSNTETNLENKKLKNSEINIQFSIVPRPKR